MPRRFKKWLAGPLAAPKVPDDELRRSLDLVRDKLPSPVFWLLGKAQSGKTSVIRALTGSSRAEIGNGFVPCTRTASLYSFPSDQTCLLRFLDTRGLGEVDYDPSDDLGVYEQQSHLLMAVVKAADHAQESVLSALVAVRERRPLWPVIVVQSSLHELYAKAGDPHVLPYPFGDAHSLALRAGMPPDLVRSLAAQRAAFEAAGIRGENVRFVPVDLTLPTDGFVPHDYGLESLWDAIEHALPHGLRGMISELKSARDELRDIHLKTARAQILWHAGAAGAAAGIPFPLVDIPLVLAIQAKMFHALASIYNQEMSPQRMAEIAGTLGIGMAGRLGIRELLKVVPGWGSAVAALYAAASTFALGYTLCAYFSRLLDGDVPEAAQLRSLYREQYAHARQHLASFVKQQGTR